MTLDTALFATITPAILGISIYVAQRHLKKKAGQVATIAAFIAFFLVLTMAKLVVDGYNNGQPSLAFVYPWISPINISFGFLIDVISFPVALIIALVTALSCFYSIKYMEKVPNQAGYYANILLALTGMIGVVFSINLVQFYLFWELMLIPSYLLIAQWGMTNKRLTTGFKYFIYSHIGALMLLLGILALYSYTGTFDLTELPSRVSMIPPHMAPVIFTFLLIGFLVKIAAFPFHTWLPDTYVEAPPPVTAMLSGAMVKCGAYGIARILLTVFSQRIVQYSDYLLILAVFTMTYGALMALAQTDIKRLFAYSSISQMGYILFGFATVSTLGIMGSLLHIMNHAICKALLFLCVGSIMHQTGTRNIRKLSGLIAKMPITGLACLIGVFSLAGAPPLNAFWSEWMIFGGCLASGKVLLAFAGVASTLITAGYLLWFAWRVFFGNVPKRLENVKEAPPHLLAPIIVLALLSILLGIWPGILLEFITPAANILSPH
jgi:NADH-quinone oxidoreductase subunit M